MKFTFKFLKIVTALLSLTVLPAAAEISILKMAGDLVLHPNEMARLIGVGADKVKNSSVWDWPEIRFAKPYKTAWTNVRARGPFEISLTTANMGNQEAAFEFNWVDPSLTIGQFQIDDTIVREINGTKVVIHLTGQCTGMDMIIPQGQWKVKGRLAWTWTSGGLEVKWSEFSFSRNAGAVAQGNFGQCQGPSGLQPALQEAFDGIVHDQSWLQDVLRDGILDWVQSSLATVQVELMKARSVTLKTGLDLTWEPAVLTGLEGGMVRVSGRFSLQKTTASRFEQSLDRTYAESSIGQVKESGFLLPKDALPELMRFLYRTGELRYRVTSDKIDSFQSLMQSRFMQFFIWPDLMNFAKNTVFYFDLTTSQAPELSEGQMMNEGGVRYRLQAPLMVHQWAPASGKYFPYVDFSGIMYGALQASVQGSQLVLELTPDNLNVGSVFRGEFAAFRNVNNWIATSILGSRVQDYLASKPFSVDLPAWPLGESLSIHIRDVQQWKQSFRVPLDFRK